MRKRGLCVEEAKKVCEFQMGSYEAISKDLDDIEKQGGKVLQESEIRRVLNCCGLAAQQEVADMKSAVELTESEVESLKGREKIYVGEQARQVSFPSAFLGVCLEIGKRS